MKLSFPTISKELWENPYILRDGDIYDLKGQMVSYSHSMEVSTPEWALDGTCLSVRMCISYTWNGRKCGYYIGLTSKGEVKIHHAFGAYPCLPSWNKAYRGTVYALLKDCPEVYDRVKSYVFKDNSIFVYWTNGGNLELHTRSKGKIWVGDELIRFNLEDRIEASYAYKLLVKGKSLREVLANLEEISFMSLECALVKPSKSDIRREIRSSYEALEEEAFERLGYDKDTIVNIKYPWNALFELGKNNKKTTYYSNTPKELMEPIVRIFRIRFSACEIGSNQALKDGYILGLEELLDLVQYYPISSIIERVAPNIPQEWKPKLGEYLRDFLVYYQYLVRLPQSEWDYEI